MTGIFPLVLRDQEQLEALILGLGYRRAPGGASSQASGSEAPSRARGAGERNGPGKLAGREAAVKAAIDAGKPTGDIAAMFGVSPSAITLLARKHGWKLTGKHRSVKLRKVKPGVSGKD